LEERAKEERNNMNDAAAKKKPETVEAPETDGGRERSTIAFPYLGLDDSAEIAKAVHTVGGSTCQWDQLAAQLGQSATSGAFRARVQTAKMYGLLTYDRGTVTLTPLGTRLCDPEQEKAARAESFLTIPLYKRVYEDFKNGTLPPTSGLETAMVGFGVAPKQKEKARQVFQRSASQAGFFAFGTSKLVMPSIRASAAATPALEPEPEPDKKKKKDDSDEGRRHPLIEGLLKELPEPQAEWTTEDRKKWLEMASTIFNVIYKDSDDSRGSLRVVVEKNSAKS
jgi:hypothetical protein